MWGPTQFINNQPFISTLPFGMTKRLPDIVFEKSFNVRHTLPIIAKKTKKKLQLKFTLTERFDITADCREIFFFHFSSNGIMLGPLSVL